MAAPLLRPAWAEIDLGALAENVRTLRAMIGPTPQFFAVCKGDGYGCGAVAAARTALAAGADAVAVGDPADGAALRDAGVTAPILLYGSLLPSAMADVADLGVTVTLHDREGVATAAALARPPEVWVKIDCGLGRLGLVPDEWPTAFAAARRAPHLRVRGLYAHLADPEDPERVVAQAATFRQACAAAEGAGLAGFASMLASSRVLVGYPELRLTAVNPGRALYGMLEGEWAARLPLRPVLSAVKSRLIQVKSLPGGGRVGVLPIGFGDGLPRAPADGAVLVRGRPAPLIGLRSMEHCVVNLSGIPEAAVGDEAVLLGRQGNAEITAAELAVRWGVSVIELLPRLGHRLHRVYLK